jgi:cytoplasmic tRNA 2-thiolation protein 1
MGYGSAEGKGKGKAMFVRGEKVGVGASGGKGRVGCQILSPGSAEMSFVAIDSTVLIHIMKLLNERYDYGLQLRLLSIDEGIKGYRDDSLEVGTFAPKP